MIRIMVRIMIRIIIMVRKTSIWIELFHCQRSELESGPLRGERERQLVPQALSQVAFNLTSGLVVIHQTMSPCENVTKSRKKLALSS